MDGSHGCRAYLYYSCEVHAYLSCWPVLTTLSTEDSSLHAIEYLNLTMKRLSELITKLLKIALTWKKGGSLTLMAKSLRQAIWNWIDNYPMEFVTLSQSVRILLADSSRWGYYCL